jgi:hypothetical protein
MAQIFPYQKNDHDMVMTISARVHDIVIPDKVRVPPRVAVSLALLPEPD